VRNVGSYENKIRYIYIVAEYGMTRLHKADALNFQEKNSLWP
jgi:hypothetical protein